MHSFDGLKQRNQVLQDFQDLLPLVFGDSGHQLLEAAVFGDSADGEGVLLEELGQGDIQSFGDFI